MTAAQLPTLNAALNTLSAVFICAGYFFIRNNNREAHRRCMLAAIACSVLFLISYLIYHFEVGSVKFQGTGLVRDSETTAVGYLRKIWQILFQKKAAIVKGADVDARPPCPGTFAREPPASPPGGFPVVEDVGT